MQREETIRRTKLHIDRLIRKIIDEKSKLDEVDLYSNEWHNLKARLNKVTKEWQSFLDLLP